jgi:trans-aconitate 2-methyltransferase
LEYDADRYARHASLQAAMAARTLGQLELEGGEHVLDVGCGDGRMTAEVAARVPRGSVLGIDPSREMIAHAMSAYAPPAWPNLRFAVGDACNLPGRHEFDLVVTFNALHWEHEQEAALRSIRGALRPGGRALVRFVPAGPRPSLEDVIDEVRRSPRWDVHFRGFRRPDVHASPEEYRSMAERNGFVVDEIGVEDEAWDFGTAESFAGWCRANFVAWTGRLTADESEAFIADVLGRYRSEVASGPEEANTFKFYQMNVRMRTRSTRADGSQRGTTEVSLS